MMQVNHYNYCTVTFFDHQFSSIQFSSFQLLNCVQLFATPWTAAHQASLSITTPGAYSNHAHCDHSILCLPLLLLPLIFPSIRVF